MIIDATVVSLLSILMIVCFMLAVICMAVWKISAKGEFVPFFGGMFVYLVFSMSLKGICDMLLAQVVGVNAWVYAIYTAVFWVVVETFGRYLGFRCVHRERNDRRTAVSFGLGFGWAEAMATVGVMSLMYFCYAVAINDSGMEQLLATLTGNDAQSFQDMADYLASLSVASCVWAIVERIARLALQTALAVFAFAAARGKDKQAIWVGAVIQLAAILPIALFQAGVGLPIWAAESVLLAATAAAVLLAWRTYHALPQPKPRDGRTRYL